MAKHTLKSGQLLKYIGSKLKNLHIGHPLKFMGYEENGFADIWVEYQGKLMLLALKDVETVSMA